MMTGAEKLKLVRELGVIRGNFPSAAGRNKLVLVKRIGEIRKLLLGVQGNNAVELVIEPTDEVASLQAIDQYLAEGFKQLPEALRTSELYKLNEIFMYLQKSPENIDFRSEVHMKVIAELPVGDNDKRRALISAMEHFKSAGDVFQSDIGYLQGVTELIKEIQNTPPPETPEIAEIKALSAELVAEAHRIRDERQALFTSVNVLDEAKLGELNKKYTEIWEKVNSLNSDYRDLLASQNRERQVNIEAAKAQLTVPGKRIIETLLNSSKVSQEQAEAWANAQVISKAAQNRLEKTGYPIADVRRDIAEFHRLSGGKLRGIAIDSKGGKRAKTNGIGSVESMVIWLDGRFNKTTLFHEMAHHLEADPAAKAASNGYLLKRMKSGYPKKLRNLTGNKGYRSDEVAYEDEFINHYIGKVYQDNTTEVWAMGVQYLATPEDAAMMLGRDPELAALMAGYLQADLTPAMKALQVLQDNKKDSNKVEREAIKSEYQQAIEKLATGIDIVDDGWFDGLEQADKDNILDKGYFGFGDPDAKFVGSWNGFRVFSGKFNKFGTKRKAKGFAVTWTLKTATLATSDPSGYWGKSREILRAIGFHGGETEMKAVMHVAEEKMNKDIFEAYRQTAYYTGSEKKMIQFANEITGTTQ